MTQQVLFQFEGQKKIHHFRGKWGFLHNFYVEPDGSLVEQEYQAAKCKNLADVKRFKGLGGRASKNLGKELERLGQIRDDWYQIRVEVMRDLVLQKFRDHRELRERLLATEDWYLEESNKHGDTFWGVVDGIGENHLGKILMWVRSVLRAEQEQTMRRLSEGDRRT